MLLSSLKQFVVLGYANAMLCYLDRFGGGKGWEGVEELLSQITNVIQLKRNRHNIHLQF